MDLKLENDLLRAALETFGTVKLLDAFEKAERELLEAEQFDLEEGTPEEREKAEKAVKAIKEQAAFEADTYLRYKGVIDER